VIIYFGFGMATVLTTVFLADTVDYGEWKTKQRSESVIFSMQTFVVQLASAFSALIAGVGIDLIKLDVNAKVQTSGTLGGLRVFMIIIPMIGLLLSLLFFRGKYRLSEETMGQIQSELKEREELQ
jgi:melibiose permease